MKADDKVFAIDTNVILRSLLRDDQVLWPKAQAIMEAVEDGDIVVTCDPITFAEVVWVLGSHYRFDPQRIREGLEPILSADGFIMPDKSVYKRALRLYTSSVPHFGDACACAAAVENADGGLLSFDRKLSRIPGIRRLEKAVR